MEKEPVSGICAEDIVHYRDLAVSSPESPLLPFSEANFPTEIYRFCRIFSKLLLKPDCHNSRRIIAGSQYGIWGSATDEQGMMPSLLLLSTIAETCGGVAMCLHAQGVASNLLLQANNALPANSCQAGLCLQEGFAPLSGTINSPSTDAPARTTTAVGRMIIIHH